MNEVKIYGDQWYGGMNFEWGKIWGYFVKVVEIYDKSFESLSYEL